MDLVSYSSACKWVQHTLRGIKGCALQKILARINFLQEEGVDAHEALEHLKDVKHRIKWVKVKYLEQLTEEVVDKLMEKGVRMVSELDKTDTDELCARLEHVVFHEEEPYADNSAHGIRIE